VTVLPRARTLFCLSALVAVLAPHAVAGEFVAPLMSRAPTVDGAPSAGEWDGAIRIDGFAWEGRLERRRASALVGATADSLCVAILSQLPDEGELVADTKRSSENLVFDDSVEVWIDPTVGAPRGFRYQLLANSLGFRWYNAHAYGGEPDNPAWSGNWSVANGLADLPEGRTWVCEVAIPLADIAPGRSVTDLVLGINVCRDWKNEWAFSSLGGAAYAPTDTFRFVPSGAPVVDYLQRGAPFDGKLDTALAVRNPGVAPIKVQADLLVERDVMPGLRERQTLEVAPGESREVAVRADDTATRAFKVSASVTSEDGARTFLSRKMEWKAGAGNARWVARKREVAPVDLQYAYYPYLNRLRVLADVTNLPPGATLTGLSGVVRRKAGETIAPLSFDNLVNGRQEIAVELPPLEGEFEIALKATGEGVPEAEIVRPFERTRFEWEHNTLGRSARVYPPFTPIAVVGNRLSTVLRDHELGDTGLWNAVSSRGKALLAEPMRWEAVVDGKPVSVTGTPLRFDQVAGNQVATTATLSLGGCAAEVKSTWDYDGTMKADLTLGNTGASSLDALDLVIPLRAEEATHLHAMGDGIRNTLYARLPEGEGVLWSADQVKANDLPERFCTYLLVGTPLRGICWFAENDRGWGWDPKTPNLDIVRGGSEVLLRVHLVNRPLTLTAPRTITFGLLAAPVKPRYPDDWRHKWRRESYSLLGTDINWLALGDCGSVYPAGGDLYLWEMIARGNREHLSDEDVQKVIDRGTPYFAPYGADRMAAFANHARYNLRGRYGTKMVFYYNRASYQLAPEFETFKDEWGLTDYRSVPKGNGIGEIKIVPTESYIDHALHWYAKSFDVGGNQGVYWDNWFSCGSYNTEMTGAYRRDDGTVIPSTGIWGLRELAKRTFQLMNERGMAPVTMPHMTSTAILPLLSFATVQYDWEWKYSEGDVQDRFSRDYILMVSNGELAGTWPVLLNDHGPQAEDPWVSRTFAACAMVHELDCPYPAWSEAGKRQLALFAPVDAILAEPGVHAYRYWDDEPPPVVADRPDVPTIVYAVAGKRAVFAAVSYTDGPAEVALRLDPARLGLAPGYHVRNTDTGVELPVENDSVRVTLPKHDVLVCEVAPG
jgi:hypothetical protein